jgi:hypothetical protein
MKRLTEGQRARVEKLATDEGTTCEGCGCARLRCGEEALRTHDHGLMVYLWCANEVHPRGGLPILHDPRRGEHRHLEASLMHPSAWKGCSRKLVSFAPLIGSSCWRC